MVAVSIGSESSREAHVTHVVIKVSRLRPLCCKQVTKQMTCISRLNISTCFTVGLSQCSCCAAAEWVFARLPIFAGYLFSIMSISLMFTIVSLVTVLRFVQCYCVLRADTLACVTTDLAACPCHCFPTIDACSLFGLSHFGSDVRPRSLSCCL